MAIKLSGLAVALLFAAIFIFGRRVAYQPGEMGRRRFLSIAAGIAVAYTFVHVMPGIHHIRDLQMHYTGFRGFFPAYNVYLWALAGFILFFGLQSMVAQRHLVTAGGDPSHNSAPRWQAWAHIGGIALYAWLLTYMMVWTGKGTIALALFAVAMGMHILPIACALSDEYGCLYDRRGAYVLAVASVTGWASGFTLRIPQPILLNLVAVVVGGVIVTAAISELPKENEARFGYFVLGAVIYAALLLGLSHLEKGG